MLDCVDQGYPDLAKEAENLLHLKGRAGELADLGDVVIEDTFWGNSDGALKPGTAHFRVGTNAFWG